jgi:hypothetical protein
MRNLACVRDDSPDGSVRLGVREQLRHLVSETLVSALEMQPFGSPRVTLVGGDEQLARAVEAECDIRVSDADGVASLPRSRSEHVAIVLLPKVPAVERIELLRAAHQSVRPAGVLVVVATVAVAPGDNRDLIPSMRQLIEELNDASGLALHVDELRSVRWYGESFVRGVLVSGISLSVGQHT